MEPHTLNELVKIFHAKIASCWLCESRVFTYLAPNCSVWFSSRLTRYNQSFLDLSKESSEMSQGLFILFFFLKWCLIRLTTVRFGTLLKTTGWLSCPHSLWMGDKVVRKYERQLCERMEFIVTMAGCTTLCFFQRLGCLGASPGWRASGNLFFKLIYF